MHHICIEVKDIFTGMRRNEENPMECKDCWEMALRKNGAHNKPVIFLHPKDFYGTLN
jgi:methylmalonyl-CoA/ethylmalonyl-CoA epimerase